MDNQNKDGMQMNIEHSIDWQEQKASKILFPQLEEHLTYLEHIYNLSFKIENSFNGIKYSQIGKPLRCQMMILMRITDFLRHIMFLTVKGYPDQAVTLTSSIFELAHTAAYFLHNPEAADKWYGCRDIQAKMPNLFCGGGNKKLVKENYSYKGLGSYLEEYKVYQQLCWMKHSHPIMQDMRLLGNNVLFQTGPYTDEKAIHNAWFSIEHSGRLTELVIGNLVSLKDEDFIKTQLKSLAKIRDKLHAKALARFGSEDPFK